MGGHSTTLLPPQACDTDLLRHSPARFHKPLALLHIIWPPRGLRKHNYVRVIVSKLLARVQVRRADAILVISRHLSGNRNGMALMQQRMKGSTRVASARQIRSVNS